jgi:hypothetical protein
MEAVISLFACVLAMSLLLSLGAKIWFLFRWHMLGWRPAILDKSLVEEAVEECAQNAVVNDARDALEVHGYEMNEDDKQHHYQRVSDAFRKVIEIYVKKFSMSGR